MYLIVAIFNVVSTALVIPRFGLIGAAFCTCLAFVIGHGIIMNMYYYKEIGLDIPCFWKNIIQMSLVPAGVSALAMIVIYYYPIVGLVQFLIYVILFIIIYMLSVWITTMNEYEKSLMKDLTRKIFQAIRLKG